MHKITVDLAEKSYDIVIGEQLGMCISEWLKTANFSRRTLVISDKVVADIYGDNLLKILQAAGLQAELFAVQPGEQAKSLAVAEQIYTKAITLGLDRKSAIFALGGGVVGDLAGFVAATYLRGVQFVQIPTSLLAQVDSSVGGKVAVNHHLGKNLIGAFYQPQIVFMDLAMLQTLPSREIYTGLAEIIKYGIIYDRDFFDFLNLHQQEILQLNLVVLAQVIERSCAIKAAVVSQDEQEAGLRIILNFGHTIAHGIESETGYALYNHGEAVAIGMYGATLLSYELGLIPLETLQQVRAQILAFHLPIRAQQCSVTGVFDSLCRDKKAVDGAVRWVLLDSIGKTKVSKVVPDHLVRKVLHEVLE